MCLPVVVVFVVGVVLVVLELVVELGVVVDVLVEVSVEDVDEENGVRPLVGTLKEVGGPEEVVDELDVGRESVDELLDRVGLESVELESVELESVELESVDDTGVMFGGATLAPWTTELQAAVRASTPAAAATRYASRRRPILAALVFGRSAPDVIGPASH